MTFTEDWYADDACKHLADLAQSTNLLEGKVIEVGCWEGKSTIAIANAVDGDVHAVDTWQGSPGEISEQLAGERDVFAQFRENIGSQTEGNVMVHVGDWREVMPTGPVRFCHIDATHSYEEVRDNINAVLPQLVDGGLVCGDDVHHPPVRQALAETIKFGIIRNGPTWHWRNTQLARDYQTACQTVSDIYEHLPEFVSLCLELNASKVIELGTRGGVSTVAWLYGLDQTDGHLWSVDIDPAPDMQHARWTFLQGDDLDPVTVKRLPDQVDIVFIDTSHAYAQTLAELNVYIRRVRPGGKIVLHDTELRAPYGLTRQPAFPVKTAVEEFCKEEGLTWRNEPRCFGLGVIDIP